MPKIKRIVLTGGACSGKTTFLNEIKQAGDHLCGYRLLYVPEAATLLSSHGMSFSDGEVPYQRAILDFQRKIEATYDRYARDLGCDVAIICDRGTLDGAAYCGKVAFQGFLDDAGITRKDLIDSYDGVVYLVTAAIGAPEHYSKESNAHRRESFEEAIELEMRTQECWEGHPNMIMIGNEDSRSFEDKMSRAWDALKDLLSR